MGGKAGEGKKEEGRRHKDKRGERKGGKKWKDGAERERDKGAEE